MIRLNLSKFYRANFKCDKWVKRFSFQFANRIYLKIFFSTMAMSSHRIDYFTIHNRNLSWIWILYSNLLYLIFFLYDRWYLPIGIAKHSMISAEESDLLAPRKLCKQTNLQTNQAHAEPNWTEIPTKRTRKATIQTINVKQIAMLNIKGKRKNRDYGSQGSHIIPTKCYQYQEKTKSQENEQENQDEEKKNYRKDWRNAK